VRTEVLQASAANYESGVDLKAVGSESGILEQLSAKKIQTRGRHASCGPKKAEREKRQKNKPELFKIPLHVHIRQIRHHVGHNFEAGVLGKLETAKDGLHCVTPVRVARNVLVAARSITTNSEG
jgi:hypothetical protein